MTDTPRDPAITRVLERHAPPGAVTDDWDAIVARAHCAPHRAPVLIGVTTLVAAAVLALAIVAVPRHDDGRTREAVQNADTMTITQLTRARNGRDDEYVRRLPSSEKTRLRRVGARIDEGRLMRTGAWGTVAAFPTTRSSVCFVVANGEGNGMVNCRTADVRSMPAVLPLFGKREQNVAWAQVVDDEVMAITDSDTGLVATAVANVAVFDQARQPVRLTMTLRSGRTVTADLHDAGTTGASATP